MAEIIQAVPHDLESTMTVGFGDPRTGEGGLRNLLAADDEDPFVNDADCTLESIVDLETGEDVTHDDLSLPTSIPFYPESDGIYALALPEDLLTDGQLVEYKLRAEFGTGVGETVLTEYIKAKGKKRRGI